MCLKVLYYTCSSHWWVLLRSWSVPGGFWSVPDGFWSVPDGFWSVPDGFWSVLLGSRFSIHATSQLVHLFSFTPAISL